MIAFVSDIHSNTEALGAVLAHIEGQGVDRIICLGDVIGYGPEPRATLHAVMKFEFTLLGNHEAAVLYYAEDFNDKARAAIEWTRDQLNDPAFPKEENFKLWGFLGDLPEVRRIDSALLVHGSPRDPVREYMLPRDARDPKKMAEIFEKMDRPACFVGHSHVPGVYPQAGGFLPPGECPDGYRVGKGKALMNVGSVGQPRDGDNRACYVTWDGETVWFHRVAYDYTSTMRKILATKALPKYLAARLKEGR